MKRARRVAEQLSKETDATRALADDLKAADEIAATVDVALDAAQNENGHADAKRIGVNIVELSAAKRRTIASIARGRLAKRRLFYFVVQGWHVLEPDTPLEVSWHHRLVCDVVQGMLVDWLRKQKDRRFRQRFRSAIVNLPPGTMKSRIVSVFAPAWMWLHRPSWTCLCLSANPDVATRDAGFMRDLVSSDWYRSTFGITWQIRDDIDAKGKFKNTAGGERTSRGMTSKVVGNRADAILIDDPNDLDEVYSEAERRKVNNKFDNSIYNRVNDQRASLRILVQQRGHEDDLSGHWLRKASRQRQLLHVCLPMEFDRTRRFHSVFGVDPRNDNAESLHPARFTKEFLDSERERLGTFGYEAQYNQSPGNIDGGIFARSMFRFFRIAGRSSQGFARPNGCANANELPAVEIGCNKRGVPSEAHWSRRAEFDEIIVSVDATFGSTTATASAVGLVVAGIVGASRYLVDDRTDVMTFPQTLDAVAQVLEDYPAVRRTLIEKKANGNAVVQTMHQSVSGLILVDPEGGKEARAQATRPSFESGNWYLLEGAPWLVKFVDELSLFPNAKRDDRVDAITQLQIYLVGNSKNHKSRWRKMAAATMRAAG